MRGLALAFLVLTGPALAQEPPAPRPAAASAEERPAPRPEVQTKAEKPPAGNAPAAETKPPTDPAPDAPTPETPVPDTPAPDTPAPDQPVAAEPGPAVHTSLREGDFDFSACLLELTLLGAEYQTQPPLTDPDQPDCGIDRPILLQAPLPGIEIPGGAPMRCDTARQLAHWLRDFVRPASALLPGQPRLVGLEQGSTYQCRATVGNDSAKLSEHAFGNAFDIAAFRFDDGSRITVEPREDSGDLAEAFQRAVRGAACLYFTTVLGPGANAAHDNHLHLDIKARRGGWRLCQ